jgi:hypothetical protein
MWLSALLVLVANVWLRDLSGPTIATAEPFTGFADSI